jgi:lysophospholipase L1-like esterase
MPSRFRILVFAAIAMTLSSLVVVTLFEGIHYFFFTHSNVARQIGLPQASLDIIRQYYFSRDRKLIQGDSGCMQFSEELLYVLRPGRCHFSNREFDTTLTILNDGRRVSGPGSGPPRITVVGDSVAMGWGVSDEEAFPAVIATQTQQTVFNLGVSSYGTARELLSLHRHPQARSADTLVIQYSDNDLRENRAYLGSKALWSRKHVPEQFARLTDSSPKGYRFGVFVSIAFTKAWNRVKTAGSNGGRTSAGEPGEAEAFLGILTRFPELKPKRILVMQAMAPGEAQDPFLDEINRIKDKLAPGWHIKTLAVSLSAADYFYLDDHMNAQGHRIVAGRILDALKRW